MWVKYLTYFLTYIQIVNCWKYISSDEPFQITNLFLENLKQDPFLINNQDVFNETKKFVDTKVQKISLLILGESDTLLRNKRNIQNEGDSPEFSINISPENQIPNVNSKDVRILKLNLGLFAVALQKDGELVIYNYKNQQFFEVLKRQISYSTLAALEIERSVLIVVGEENRVTIFIYHPEKNILSTIHVLKIEKPQHVTVWMQEGVPYMSVLYASVTNNEKSFVTIYKWLGGHFDLVQTLELFHIKKIIHFSIHETSFIVAIKQKAYSDDIQSFSEVFKYDINKKKFTVFQRLLTECSTDIKHFFSELHGEKYNFLITTSASCQEAPVSKTVKSIIYKYEDQYFIPFQSIETEAIEWQPIQDNNRQAALLALSTSGVKGFQYDGWRFIEYAINADEETLQQFRNVKRVHVFENENDQFLVTLCSNCNSTHIYKITFKRSDLMKNLHADMLHWCTDTLNELQSEKYDVIVGEARRGDLNNNISPEEEEQNQLFTTLKEIEADLPALGKIVQEARQSGTYQILDDDVDVENIIFKASATVNSLETTTLNNVSINDLLENSLNIFEGFDLEENANLTFDKIKVAPHIELERLNGVSLDSYIHVDKDNNINVLVVDGDIFFNENIYLAETINNITVDKETLLLDGIDQTFSTNLTVDQITITNLTTKSINDLDFEVFCRRNSPVTQLDELIVEEIEIAGLMNRISLEVLHNKTLKRTGLFNLSEDFFVSSLTVDKLNVTGKISGKKIEDFVVIDTGIQTIEKDVYFEKGLIANKLEVLHSINNTNITVNGETGELEVLLKNTSEVQIIKSKKTFEYLTLIKPIKMRNKITSQKILQMNPIEFYKASFEINSNVTIEGDCQVKKLLNLADLKGVNGKGFKYALENGIETSDHYVSPHLTFSYPLDLDDVVADKVNDHDPHNWLLKWSDSTQKVTGKKTFLDNLSMDGQTNAFIINHVHVPNLQRDILRIKDDQIITGHFEIDELTAEKGITSQDTYFGTTLWNKTALFKDTLDSDIQIINDSLQLNYITAKTVEIKGLLNTLNINDVTKDLVKVDSDFKVFGIKNFENLYVDELLITDEESELSALIKSVEENEVTLNKNFDLYFNIYPKNIKFNKELNNLSKAELDSLLSVEGEQSLVGPMYGEYDEIVVFGDVIIEDNKINGKDLDSIVNDTVKVDEDHAFNDAEVDHFVSVENMFLEGNIDGLDLENTVAQNSTEPVEMFDKNFFGNVSVEGTLTINAMLNGMDIETICELDQNHNPRHFKIEGSVMFGKGPKVLNINGQSLNDLKNNLWFVDQPANISGRISLQNATFRNHLNVKDYIDNINLKLISQNYLSKTKRQEISSKLSFENVTFVNISAPSLKTGPVNGIKLEELLKTILLQGVQQVFEEPAYFETVRVKDLQNNNSYTVNGLNLNEDVMLYDKQNIVTGQKAISNMTINNLRISEGTNVQNVNMLNWLSNSMLKDGTFRVPVKLTVNRAVFQSNLSLKGLLNGLEFNSTNLMLFDTPQTISGKKIFVSNPDAPIKFKHILVKGLVNNVDLRNIVSNQANKNNNNVINSKILFNNTIDVDNVNMDLMYGGVNVSDLLKNISEVGALERFRESFETLSIMGQEAETSLKGQGSFFKYFKEIMRYENIADVFGLHCSDGIFRIVTFSFLNYTNYITTFELDIHKDEFVRKADIIEHLGLPSFLEQVTLNGKDYLYFERADRNEASLWELVSADSFKTVAIFPLYSTQQIISFDLPGRNQSCLGNIGFESKKMVILCNDNSDFYLLEELQFEGLYKATTVCNGNILYIILATRGPLVSDPAIHILKYEFDGQNDQFVEVQTIYEGSEATGLSAAVIDKVPYIALSFTSQEATVDLGRISIRRLDESLNKFLPWQHIPLTSPLGVHFLDKALFEPLLLATSRSTNSPCPTFRYDGVAGFQMILKGSTIPINSHLRIMSNNNVVAVIQRDTKTATILGAVVKGNLNI